MNYTKELMFLRVIRQADLANRYEEHLIHNRFTYWIPLEF
jgi:hypothetical protein